MTKWQNKKVSRREFLKTAGIAGGAAAVAGALTACSGGTTTILNTTTKTATTTATTTTTATGTTTITSPVTTTVTTTTPVTTTVTAPPAVVYKFFNPTQVATVKAIFGQLIPGTADDPGAVEAGADVYIDHALAGFYSSMQATYRLGLISIDAYSQSKYSNDFASLSSTQQIAVLTDMQSGTATGFVGAGGATGFFNTLLGHVREGTFSDPAYGGNQNMVGWTMIGFPGAQVAYGDPQMAVGADQSKIVPPLDMTQEEMITMPAPSGPLAGF